MRGALLWTCLGVAVVVGALLSASAAHAQAAWFDPSLGHCDLGQMCVEDGDCIDAPGAPVCLMVGDGADPRRCRPRGGFFVCCAGVMCAGGAVPVPALGALGVECICVHPAIADCFGSDDSPPITSCLTDPDTMGPVTSIPEGDCDGDRCPNGADLAPCDGTVGCPPPPDAGPRDGGPRDGGPDATRPDGAIDASIDPGDSGGVVCPGVVLPEEDCGPEGRGNGCDDDANGLVDDGCGDMDGGDMEDDAAMAPRDSGPRRDLGAPPDEDAGEEPEPDAGEEPKMDAASGDPIADGRTFRGSGGCGLCSVSSSVQDGIGGWLSVGLVAIASLLRSRRRRLRPPGR